MANEIRVVAFLKVKPGSWKAVEAAVQSCASASRAEEGCLMYAGHWDESVENRLVFVEHWRSQADLDEHMTKPHFHLFVAATGDLLESAPEMIVLHEIR